MKIITPTTNKDGMIFFGPNGLDIQGVFGIRPDKFLKMFALLVSEGLKIIINDVRIIVDFVLYCTALVDASAEVGTLIQEFNASQKGDGTELMHALSLTKLYYHFNAAGYSVLIQKTHKSESRADLVVNDVECDLKVRQDQTWRRMEKHKELLFSGKQDDYHEIYAREIRSMQEDLKSAIANRVYDGFKQADCIILDLSDNFHTWNYHRLKSMEKVGTIKGLSVNPIPPLAKVCILFSPDNTIDLTNVGFTPKAYWGYLPLL